MSSYNSSRDMAAKMDSEGGLAEFIFGYGLSLDNLPADMPEEIRDGMEYLLGAYETYSKVQQWLYARFDEDPKPGDYDYQEPE